MKKLIFIILLLNISISFSQTVDDYVNLLRSDLKTEKSKLITETMEFTEAEASKFWPIYNKYSLKLNIIGDKRVIFIKDFATNYYNMTDVKAKVLMEEAFDFQEDRTDLLEDLYEDLEKVLGATKAAKLVQLEHMINILIDLEVNSELPLIERATNNSIQSK
jgi:hypothetical protein